MLCRLNRRERARNKLTLRLDISDELALDELALDKMGFLVVQRVGTEHKLGVTFSLIHS